MTNSPREDKDASVDPRPMVLVVDDHDETRTGCAEYLRMSGFRTEEAENGVAAITRAREITPDAIVLDYAMPMMDGVQAALFLKLEPATRGIPILMLSAFNNLVSDRGRCDAYLEKPCAPELIVAKLRELLAARATTAVRARADTDHGTETAAEAEISVDDIAREIERTHGAVARFVEFVDVEEHNDGKPLWKGAVGVFSLEGHPHATRAYAYVNPTPAATARISVVLEISPVDSAAAAVRTSVVPDPPK